MNPLQALNDALAKLVPIVQAVLNPVATLNKSLGELQKSLGALVDTAVKAATSAVKAFGDVLGAVVSPLAGLGDGFLKVVGSMVAGIQAIGAKIASVFQGGALGAVADYFGSIIDSVVAALGTVGSVLFDVVAACGDVVMAFVGVAAAVVAVGAGILALGEAMSIFVGKANPALVQVFTNAVDDLMAVIGQGLAPTFQVVTALVRMMADSLQTWVPQLGVVVGIMAASLLPAFRMMGDALGRMGQVFTKVIETILPGVIALVEAFVGVLDALSPMLTDIIGLMGGIMVEVFGALTKAVLWATPYLMAFGHVLTDVVGWIVKGIKELLALIGIDFNLDTKALVKDSSVGTAAKGTSIGDIDSVIKKAQQSAFSLGTGASDPPTRTAAASEAMKARADEIYKFLTVDLPAKGDAWLESAPGLVWAAFLKLPFVETVTNFITHPPGSETNKEFKNWQDKAAEWLVRQAGSAEDWVALLGSGRPS